MTTNREIRAFRCQGKRAAIHLIGAGAAALAVMSSAAAAQEASESEDDAIVVSGYRYLSENTSGTTGLPVPIEKVPQSISLVSEDFLDATDAKSLGDVAQYTPGALFDGNPGGTSSIVKLGRASCRERVCQYV